MTFDPRHCGTCNWRIPPGAPVFDPGTTHGPHRPVFCCEPCRDTWLDTPRAPQFTWRERMAKRIIVAAVWLTIRLVPTAAVTVNMQIPTGDQQ